MKIGDEITAVDLNGRVVAARVVEVGQTGRIASTEFIFRNRAGDDTVASRGDESVTWIRGWHAENSPEFAALLAAWKLRPQRGARSLVEEAIEGLLRPGRML